MKNPERVAELLAELRELADNDFELHRIDVLERDLTAPPQVEVIDDTHQYFNGVVYSKNKSGHFVSHDGVHRAIWFYYHGEILAGYQIHHIDENKANNDIKNLQCLTALEHRKIHAPDNIPQIFKTFTCVVCGKSYTARAVSKNCFCSKECHNAYHSDERICPVCGKTFKGYEYQNQKFCSRSCMHKARELNAKETRICPECGKTFITKKSSKKVCCSHLCGRHHRQPIEQTEYICEVCGKTFYASKGSRAKYCSIKCRNKAQRSRWLLRSSSSESSLSPD